MHPALRRLGVTAPRRLPRPFGQFSLAPVFRATLTSLTATTTSLTASANPSLFGQSVTFTAFVTPGDATGTVTFYDKNAVLGVAPLFAGHAALTTVLLPFGLGTIGVRYNGDLTHAASALGLPQRVNVLPITGYSPSGTLPVGPGAVGPPNPNDVVTGDFNRDGIPDLAVANAGLNTISVLLGSGGAVFQSAVDYPAGRNPFGLTVCDLNGDGAPDLAVINISDDTNTLSILFGNGDGTFDAPVPYQSGSQPVALAAADFNNDGRVDLAVVNFGDENVAVFLANAAGALASPTFTLTGAGPSQLAVADFNADGRADIAVANSNDNTVSVLLGNGNGTFAAAFSPFGGFGPFGLITDDFDQDGRPDLAIADYGDFGSMEGGGVTVLLSNGNGTFQPPRFSLAGIAPSRLVSGDFNGDGVLDVAAAEATDVSILLGSGDGFFQIAATLASATSPAGIAVADLNADSASDLIVTDLQAGNVTLFTGVPGQCAFSLSNSVALFDASGGTTALSLLTNSPGCAWTGSGSPWIVPASASGNGNAAMNATIQPNTTGFSRSGTFSIGGSSIAVNQTATAQTFSDVPLGSYYFDAVNLLRGKSITNGCGPGLYCPGSLVTRAQMAIFIIRTIFGSDNFTASSTPYFTDVPPGAFGFAWIQKMWELGITSGCGPGLYCPDSGITRAQMAVFIIRARYGATSIFDFQPAPFFTDVLENDFGFRWVQRMRQDLITSGCGIALFCPAGPVIRGDMAIFIMRAGFNATVPAGTPVLSQATPSSLPLNQTTTVSVTGSNTHFVQGQTIIKPMLGVSIGSIVVNGPGELTVDLTPSAPSAQPLAIVAVTGSESVVLPNALRTQ